MKFHKTAVVAAAALALAAAACGKEGSPADKSTSSGGSPAPKLPTYQVNTGAHVHGSAAFDRMSSKGKITIGVKADQPYLGFEDANTGDKLWGRKIGGAIGGGVITYESEGRQLVAVATGLTEVIWPSEQTTAKVSVLGIKPR